LRYRLAGMAGTPAALSLSGAELATRTGLNDQTVRRWLTIMRDEGSVELVGTSPRSTSARYRRTRQGELFSPSGPEGAL
jgi:ATP-dependent DNA helicase RecG